MAYALLGALHVYIWWRLVAPLPAPWWHLGTATVALFGPAFPFLIRRGKQKARADARPWLLAGYGWFGLANYLLLGAAASHIAVACGADAGLAAATAAASAVAVAGWGYVRVALAPTVVRVRVPLAKLPVPEYRVVHLSDVHIGPLIGRAYAEKVVRAVNELAPDLIVITGDLIDGELRELQEHIEPLRGLRARDGVYAVTGNHEYYWDTANWIAHLRSLGIRVLHDENVVVGGALVVAGMDDATEDLARAVAGRDPALPLVLLAHYPRTIARARLVGVDLQLSGHTHGGQLLPLGWFARLFDPRVSGLGRFGDSWLYVSQGTGFWGPPMRVGTSCEIGLLTLVPQDGAADS
jgi:predicted MPP superfamily phosphohydrolase